MRLHYLLSLRAANLVAIGVVILWAASAGLLASWLQADDAGFDGAQQTIGVDTPIDQPIAPRAMVEQKLSLTPGSSNDPQRARYECAIDRSILINTLESTPLGVVQPDTPMVYEPLLQLVLYVNDWLQGLCDL